MSLPFFSGEFHLLGVQFVGDELLLNYRIQAGHHGADYHRADQLGADQHRYQFCERIRYPGAPELASLPADQRRALEQAAQLLLVMAGTSYYKALVPKRIVATDMDASLAELSRAVYLHGLGEFAYQNKIKLDPQFPVTASKPRASGLALADRALVAIGGGKDSLVSVEALRTAATPACAVWIGNSELIAATAIASGLPTLNIERKVDPALFALNQQGALNGHIPVTAINSAILAVASIWYGYRWIVFSNEASADSATLHQDGEAINHQWSKSFAFEELFANYLLDCVASDLHYLSLLRPYRELAIAKAFAKNQRYDSLFSSCNRNFKILGAKPALRWCGMCPKCHFVFLALAPFVAKPRLLAIFGRNLLDELDQAPGFDALMELDGAHKPFECVGEAQESRAAMQHLATRADWQEDILVQRFIRNYQTQLAEVSIAELLLANPRHRVPDVLLDSLQALMS